MKFTESEVYYVYNRMQEALNTDLRLYEVTKEMTRSILQEKGQSVQKFCNKLKKWNRYCREGNLGKC